MKALLALGAVVFVSGLGFCWSMDVGRTLGLVSMDYLNGWLSDLAARDDADLVPLRLAWGWDLSFWPWAFFGLGLESLSATGKIVGREERILSVTAFGFQGRIGLEFSFLSQLLKAEAGAGGVWAWTSGLLEASGPGWDGFLVLSWRFFQFWGLELAVGLEYRWAWVPVLHTPREELRPRTGPAVDFTGLFGKVILCWTW